MKTITPDQVSRWSGRIVDVRNPDEYAAERLPRAESVPLGTLPTAVSGWDRNQPLLVMCKSGMRSRQGYEQLVSAGFSDVTMLAGGLDACKKAGIDVIVVRKTIPLFRQVLLAAGGLLLIGLLLGTQDARFLVIDWFVALGLTFAGLTGMCPMARLLEKMPWNRLPESTPVGGSAAQAGSCCSTAKAVKQSSCCSTGNAVQ